jgi:cytochrome P450
MWRHANSGIERKLHSNFKISKESSDILFLACWLQVKRYTPFGQGVRNCLGQQLARMNVPTAVAMFMSEFEFTVAPQVRLNLFLKFFPFSESLPASFMGGCHNIQLCWIT